MPCSGYTLRVNNLHTEISCQIRDADGMCIRDYANEDVVVPGEQVKVIRNNCGGPENPATRSLN